MVAKERQETFERIRGYVLCRAGELGGDVRDHVEDLTELSIHPDQAVGNAQTKKIIEKRIRQKLAAIKQAAEDIEALECEMGYVETGIDSPETAEKK